MATAIAVILGLVVFVSIVIVTVFALGYSSRDAITLEQAYKNKKRAEKLLDSALSQASGANKFFFNLRRRFS
jgi:hypothetical protein